MAVQGRDLLQRRGESHRAQTETASEDGAAHGPVLSPAQVSLLSIQRSAGNAAVVQILRQRNPPNAQPGLLREPAPAEAPPVAGSVPASQSAAAPGAGSGQAFATDWFVDYDQMKRGGGKAGERGKNDALWVQSLIVGHGSEIHELKGFNAAASGPALLGHVQHPPGSGHVSGNIQYISSADVKVNAFLTNAASKGTKAKHQQQVADAAAQDYVRRQFHLEQGNEDELEQGAQEAANAALEKEAEAESAAGAGGDPVSAPTANKVDIKVVGRHMDQPSLPTVNYAIGGDSNCTVDVIIPSKEYKGTVSGQAHTGEQHFREKGGSRKDVDKGGGSVDVTGSGSQTTQQSVDARLKQSVERRQKFVASFSRSTRTALSGTLDRTYHEIFSQLFQGDETISKKTLPDVSIDVENEDQAKHPKDDDPSLWSRAVDKVKEKLKDYLEDKLFSWLDNLAGKEYPIWRAVPGAVKGWVKKKVKDLVWKGGKWLWNKITGGEAEVKRDQGEKHDAGDDKVIEEWNRESTFTYSKLKEETIKATTTWSTEVSEEVRRSFESALDVKTEVDVGASSSKGTSQSGSVGVHGKAEHGQETSSDEHSQDSSQKEETHLYTTEVVRIETGKPVIELAITPK